MQSSTTAFIGKLPRAVALNLKGIAYEAVNISLLDGIQSCGGSSGPQPAGVWPALEIDGLMLTQSVAMIEYLDARHPEPAPMPAEPAEAARLRAITHAVAMDIHPICNLNVMNHHAAAFNGDLDDKKAWVRHFIGKGLRAVEARQPIPTQAPSCMEMCPEWRTSYSCPDV